MMANWLKDALAQVDRINREAEEEGYPLIGERAKRNARHVLSMAGRSSIEPLYIRPWTERSRSTSNRRLPLPHS